MRRLKFLVLFALLAASCMTANEKTDCKETGATIQDTVYIKDTVFLADRPKAAGETDPPTIKRVHVGPDLESYIYIDTVNSAAGYRLYVSLSENKDFVQFTTATFTPGPQRTFLPGEPTPDHNGYFFYRFSSLFAGKTVYFRVSAISKTGVESGFSEFMVAVLN